MGTAADCFCKGEDPEFPYHGPNGCGVEKRWADWAASPGIKVQHGASGATKRPDRRDKGDGRRD